MRFLVYLLFLIISLSIQAQTLGGNAAFSFLHQPNTSQLTALGGINISNISSDVGLSFSNPALLKPNMHKQINTSFNSFFSGIKNYGLTTAYDVENINTTFGFGINYFNYGTITQTDAIGNVLGSFNANDYVAQVMFNKQYKERWYVGATLKYISSNYGQFTSNGVATDIGITYYDSSSLLQVSFVVKNIGTQLKTYTRNTFKQELPFDIQFGITKRLQKAPLQFSLTLHQLQQLNIYYQDTVFNNLEGISNNNKTSLQKLINHLIFATQIFIKDKIECTIGYNFLRRKDLNIFNSTNGVNGFSMGLGVLLKKAQIRYSTGFYQQNQLHQLGINFSVDGR